MLTLSIAFWIAFDFQDLFAISSLRVFGYSSENLEQMITCNAFTIDFGGDLLDPEDIRCDSDADEYALLEFVRPSPTKVFNISFCACISDFCCIRPSDGAARALVSATELYGLSVPTTSTNSFRLTVENVDMTTKMIIADEDVIANTSIAVVDSAMMTLSTIASDASLQSSWFWPFVGACAAFFVAILGLIVVMVCRCQTQRNPVEHENQVVLEQATNESQYNSVPLAIRSDEPASLVGTQYDELSLSQQPAVATNYEAF